MSQDRNPPNKIDQNAGLEVGVNEAGVSKTLHDQWVETQNYSGGHDLSKETKGTSVDGSGGADGAGTGTFNEAVRPVKK